MTIKWADVMVTLKDKVNLRDVGHNWETVFDLKTYLFTKAYPSSVALYFLIISVVWSLSEALIVTSSKYKNTKDLLAPQVLNLTQSHIDVNLIVCIIHEWKKIHS